MTVKEMREKSIKLMRDAQALLHKETVTPEDRASFDKMIVDADALEADAVRMEALDKKIEGYERGHVPPRAQPGAGNDPAEEVTRQQRSDFEKFIRFGTPYKETRDMSEIIERRDLTTGTNPGPQLVPQAFYPVLIEAKKAYGQVIDAVYEKETDTGAPMKIATANDTANAVHVVGEQGPVTSTDPALDSFLTETDQLVTDFIKVSYAELQDSAFDLDKFIRDLFGKRYFRGLSKLITNGSTSGNIESLVGGAFEAVTSLEDDSIDYEDLTAMYGVLDPDYLETASWMMKSTTRAKLLGVKDSLGRPLYIPDPTTGGFTRLLGLPVLLNQFMDEVSPSGGSPSVTKKPILLGDFKQGYLLRSVKPGMAIARLNERFADILSVGFLGYFRSGGVVTDAGTHPIVSLAMAD